VISVVIPVRNGGEELRMCLDAIRKQRLADEVEVVVVDSESTDGSADMARAWGASVHVIVASEFHHGRTRNLGAKHARGETLVFTTQDAYAHGTDWLATLVAPLRDRRDLAGVYGRQLAKPDAKPPERYFLDFLYGSEPREQRASELSELTMETTLFSNVNAAIPRRVWEDFPFAEDIIMSEDQEWCGRVLLSGFSVRYEPQAVVRHSHDYTIPAAFRRFFDSGVSAERTYLAGRDSAARALRRTALSYALGELTWLWRTGQELWIPYTAVYELAKLAGLRLGARHRALPLWLKKSCSAYPGYWTETDG